MSMVPAVITLSIKFLPIAEYGLKMLIGIPCVHHSCVIYIGQCPEDLHNVQKGAVSFFLRRRN